MNKQKTSYYIISELSCYRRPSLSSFTDRHVENTVLREEYSEEVEDYAKESRNCDPVQHDNPSKPGVHSSGMFYRSKNMWK